MDSWMDLVTLFENIDIEKELDEVMKDNSVQKYAIGLNQYQLFEEGIDSQGKIIRTIDGDPYTKRTINEKIAKGLPSDIVTLYDTGDFYKTFGVKIMAKGYEIVADFSKGGSDIRDNFQPGVYDFLGLTEESLEQLIDNEVFLKLGKRILAKIGL